MTAWPWVWKRLSHDQPDPNPKPARQPLPTDTGQPSDLDQLVHECEVTAMIIHEILGVQTSYDQLLKACDVVEEK